ncbi:Lsr2 family protein [Micromonospora sp. NBC_00362]|uniref:histone-like nucleoid-structuring protein Lsr2 n=1 Tax=Micromonospora sp. NBC_00362 TaxID=2975975 RepID=UPI0022525315|nr:Lsr2 family protein [Micromonospora sp. NBC_00362]MCX5121725.1 Lsr2 family protein [Micromonospora sp. NBC_00362]
MARKVVTVLTDDLDGGTADRTVEFSLDGVAYSIDLSDEHAGALRKALDPYISAGRRAGRVTGGNGRTARTAGRAPALGTTRDENRAIREWATGQGHKISERGRIPISIVQAYRNR